MNEYDSHDLDLVGPYVLDALSLEEREAFEAHLRGCSTCQAEVAELRQVVDVLPLAAEPIEPPADLRDRILAAVSGEEAEKQRFTVLPGGTPKRGQPWRSRLPAAILAAVAAVLIAALAIRDVQLQQRVNDQQALVNYHQQVAAAIAQGDTVSPVLGTKPAVAAANAALIQPRSGKSPYLIVQGLPATPTRKVYQLWLLRGTAPRSAGVFTYAGSAPKIVVLPLPPEGYSATAVTLEPGPRGSRSPTTQPVLSGRLAA